MMVTIAGVESASAAIHPLAGRPAPPELLVNVPRLVTAYYTRRPDPDDPHERLVFGTSGHRGSSLCGSFNEAHILAASQAVVDERRAQVITGPLLLGAHTHALSEPAFASTLEVLAANGVDVFVAARITRAPGNDAPLGGLKVVARSGWFAARPSGTEAVYKLYAESFRGEEHLRAIQRAARKIVATALQAGA
jgi:phosphoglucomutase